MFSFRKIQNVPAMAEPLIIIGGVARVVQLADVVGRLSKPLSEFFWAIKDAPDQVKKLRSTLEGLEATMALVKRHGNEIAKAVASNFGTDFAIDLVKNSPITLWSLSLQS